jgi:hypothetical protein
VLIVEWLEPGIEHAACSGMIALPQLVSEVATQRDPRMQHAPVAYGPRGEDQ